jgi:protein SCO1/2
MNRTLIVLAAVLSVLLVIGLGVLGYHRLAGSGDSPSLPKIGGPFALVDGAGKTVTDQQFRGRYMLIYFGYTHCPDACPTALSDMATALGKLVPAQRAKIQPIFITVDPERDNGQVLADYAAAFGSDFIGLGGSLDQLATVKKEFHVYAEKHPAKDGDYDMDHSSIIYLMDPDNRFIGSFTQETDPEDMAKKLSAVAS